MSSQQKTTLRKKAMLEALEKTLGIVTPAAKMAGIERTTHYKWLREDEDYAEKANSFESVAIDFAESHLHKQIKEGVPSSTIFYLKTKGKKRGYTESTENVNINRNINTDIDIDKLSKDDKRKILEILEQNGLIDDDD